MLELAWLHALDGGRHAGGLDLEDARRVATTHQRKDLWVIKGNLVHIDVDAGCPRLDGGAHRLGHALDILGSRVVGPDVGERLRDDGQGAQAQEVHLQKAHVGHGMALELRDLYAALGVELRGHVIVHRGGRDEHRTGMHALTAREPFDRKGSINDAVGVGVLLVCLRKLGAVLILLARGLLEHKLELCLWVVGDHL